MCSIALQAPRWAKETSFFAITESMYSPSTPDQLGKGVRVVFLGQNIPDNVRNDRKIFAEWVQSAPQETILSVTSVSVPEPEPAIIRDSVHSSVCDETVMESRLRTWMGNQFAFPVSRNNRGSSNPLR